MGILADVREVADLVRKVGDMDLYRKMIDLQSEVIELADKNSQLTQTVNELTAKLALTETMKFHDHFYWRDVDPEPYCPRCFDVDRKAVHVIRPRAGSLPWKCPQCKFEVRLNAVPSGPKFAITDADPLGRGPID
ncbi:MAG: hypothetical protein P4L92_00445 [Rudaea sp.]|nr:hypothetical protein [Rudaea sp.]